MSKWKTLAARKADAVRKKLRGFAVWREELAAYASREGGHFLLYGSMARGDCRFDSDVDILVDFPLDKEPEAWQFAEDACHKLGLQPDVKRKRYCAMSFLESIARDVVELP